MRSWPTDAHWGCLGCSSMVELQGDQQPVVYSATAFRLSGCGRKNLVGYGSPHSTMELNPNFDGQISHP